MQCESENRVNTILMSALWQRKNSIAPKRGGKIIERRSGKDLLLVKQETDLRAVDFARH